MSRSKTNNSSITSKRSVEKLYYPSESHFFRFFVPKFQRRAPLINRGYHLRLRVIDVLVRDFILSESNRKKVVVNLGCGSDVLPWQCWERYPAATGDGVRFVDVDFPELMVRKRGVVLATPELSGVLSGVKDHEGLAAPVVLESDQYVQIACDLRELGTLQKGLETVLGDMNECEFLFVAEVSITYMETDGANGVIRWASGLGKGEFVMVAPNGRVGKDDANGEMEAEFVLLEQILPEGPKHPFAETMLNHFEKLNSQLKSVHTYPTLSSQLERFSSRGWGSVRALTLWQAWSDDEFFTTEDRQKLEEIDPFDEWEEFALFGSHYCLIHARAEKGEVRVVGYSGVGEYETHGNPTPDISLVVQHDECSGQRGQRRFAAAMVLSEESDSNQSNQSIIVNTLGLGTKGRLQSCDVFHHGSHDAAVGMSFGDGGPASRMCHSLTHLGEGHGSLLSGGRAAPFNPFQDCWLFDKTTKIWNRTHDLPIPLYRHSATSLTGGLALLAGGRTSKGAAFEEFLLYEPKIGWIACEVVGEVKPTPVYGAALAARDTDVSSSGKRRGVYIGGLRNGTIVDQILSWELDVTDRKVSSEGICRTVE